MIRSFVLLCLISTSVTAQNKYSFTQPAMGSPFTITIVSGDSLDAARAAAAAFRLADSLNGILSDYIDSSEINRLSATSGQGRWVRVSPPLFDILRRAQEAATLTHGSYDISIGSGARLGRRAFRRRRTILPQPWGAPAIVICTLTLLSDPSGSKSPACNWMSAVLERDSSPQPPCGS